MINKFYLYRIYLIIIICISNNNGVFVLGQVQGVSYSIEQSFGYTYLNSFLGSCQYSFSLKVNNNLSPVTELIYDIEPGLTIKPMIIDSVNNYSIFSINCPLTVNIPKQFKFLGNTLNPQVNSLSKYFSYDLNCLDFNVEGLSVDIDNSSLVANDGFNGISGLLSIGGLKYPIKEITASSKYAQVKIFNKINNLYYITFSSPPQTNIGVWLIDLLFPNKNLTVALINNLFKKTNNLISDYKVYEPSMKTLRLMGTFTPPCFTFTLNENTETLQSYPFFFVKLFNDFTLNNPVIQVSFNNVPYYLGDFSKFNSIDQYSISIFSTLQNPIANISYQYNNNYVDAFPYSLNYLYKSLGLSQGSTGSSLTTDKITLYRTSYQKISHTKCELKNGGNIVKFLDFPYGYGIGSTNSFIFNFELYDPMRIITYRFEVSNTSFSSNARPNIISRLRYFKIDRIFNRYVMISVGFYIESSSNFDNVLIGKPGDADKLFRFNSYNETTGLYQMFYKYSKNPFNRDDDRFSFRVLSTNGAITTFVEDELFIDQFSNKGTILSPSNYFTEFNSEDIESITFKENVVNTTLKSTLNRVYVKLNTAKVIPKGDSIPIGFQFRNGRRFTKNPESYQDLLEDSEGKKVYYLDWNGTSKSWESDFIIPANLATGQIYYYILSSKQLHNNFYKKFPLTVFSNQFDLLGPIIYNLSKLTQIESSTEIEFGWDINIKDELNGFKNGFIVVRGDIDNSIYNYTLTSKIGNNILIENDVIKSIDFKIRIKISKVPTCATQTYSITELFLQDNQDHITKFNQVEEKSQLYPQLNPFLFFFNSSSIITTNIICPSAVPSPNNSNTPIVTSLALKNSQLIEFNNDTKSFEASIVFTVYSYYGIKNEQYPTCYLNSGDLDFIYSKAILESFNDTSYNYSCAIPVRRGFGYPNQILLSIFGLISNIGLFNGYTSGVLFNTFGIGIFPNSVSVPTFSIPVLTNVHYSSGSFWIQGYNLFNLNFIMLTNVTSSTKIYYEIDNSIDSRFQNLIKVNIQSLSGNFDFLVMGIGYDSRTTNTLFIDNRLIVSYEPPTTPPIVPTLTPIQKCSGTPLCGGTDHGYCSQTVGCICYSPYIGIDCTSQVIVIPQPNITKPTDPSVIIETKPIEDNNNQTSGNQVLLSSIISIAELREINSNNNTIIKRFKFEKWVQTTLSPTVSQYISNDVSDGLMDPPAIVNVRIEWFSNSTNVSFAGQSILINPSTLKYTITISQYKYQSRLNNLQLIMNAKVQSNQSDNICSSYQFGESFDYEDENSINFIKLQIGKYSLRGKYIKRAIIDSSRIVTIKNEILYDLDNQQQQQQQQQAISTQSYVGITIPYFLDSAILDPDFSVLLDSGEANSDSPNSVCRNDFESGLSKGELIGIIIGSAIFFITFVAILIYLIYKTTICLPVRIFLYKISKKSKV
ncbi:hypothetical protein ACTFIW_010165 [Dictyostelium discoideum]